MLRAVDCAIRVADDLLIGGQRSLASHGRSRCAQTDRCASREGRSSFSTASGSEVGPGQIAAWIKITTNRVNAYGFRSDCAGKSSKHIPFDWKGPA